MHIKPTEDNVCSPDSDFLQTGFSLPSIFLLSNSFVEFPNWTLDGDVTLLCKVINVEENPT